MSLLIKNIKTLSGILENNSKPLRLQEFNTLNEIHNAWISIKDGKIENYGCMNDIEDHLDINDYNEQIDATGKIILPAFCDSHTHIVFAGSRENEFVDRIKGLSYEEIAKRGGGILNSAKKLQACSVSDSFLSFAITSVIEFLAIHYYC